MNSHYKPEEGTRPQGQIPLPGNVEAPLTPTEARQGRRGSPVLVVLIAGIVLAMVAWAGAEWWGQSTEPPADQTAKPPAASTAAPVNPDRQPSSNP